MGLLDSADRYLRLAQNKRKLGLSEGQIFLNSLDEDDPYAFGSVSNNDIISGWDEKEGFVEFSINNLANKNKDKTKATDRVENTLTAGQIKQIEIELKIYLGISDEWKKPVCVESVCDSEDEEFDHYKTESKSIAKSVNHPIIIPADFNDLIPMYLSERQNEYPSIVKRLSRHKKLTELASASKSNPKMIEKSLEKLFTEMKNLLEIK